MNGVSRPGRNGKLERRHTPDPEGPLSWFQNQGTACALEIYGDLIPVEPINYENGIKSFPICEP